MTQQHGGLVTDEQGRMSWWNPEPAAVAAGVFSPAPGVTVSVDLIHPQRVLAWTMPGHGSLETLTALFGEAWASAMRDLLADAPHRGMTMAPAPPPLPEAWARVGLVAGVRRWLPAAVSEATVGIDQGLACHQAGLDEQAAAEFAAVSASLLYRAERCLNGDLPTAMRPGLLAATRVAAQLLGDEHPAAAELHDLAAELQAAEVVHTAAGAADEDLRGALPGAAPAVDVSAAAAPEAMAIAYVDPALVPARILRWDGAEAPELLVETYTNPHRLRISAVLTDDTEPDDQEVTELVARVLDPSEGTVCGSGVFLPAEDVHTEDGHRIVAELPLHAPPPDPLVVQVYQAGRPHPFLHTIRDPSLIRVDRLMLEAWMRHRLALAARVLGDPACETLLQEAADRARDAAAALGELTATPADAEPLGPETAGAASLAGLRLAAGRPTLADLRARTAAIDAYLTVLVAAPPATAGGVQDPVAQPLLAELELLAAGEAPITVAAAVMIRDIEAWLVQKVDAHRTVDAVMDIALTVPALVRAGYAPDVLVNARVNRKARTAEITITLNSAHNPQPLTVTITSPDGTCRSAAVDSLGHARFENVPITSGDLRIRLEPRS
ncbi:hypothetical protein ACWGI8_36075 [Streptomyces sp. NPDC054841]